MSTTKNTLPHPGGSALGPRRFAKGRSAARRIGVHYKTLFKWAEQGLISKFKVGPRAILFDEDELDRLIESGRIGGR